MRHRSSLLAICVALLSLANLAARSAAAQNMVVRFPEGDSRGLATLSTPTGKVIASGDMRQLVRKNGEVESWLIFHFADGSIDSDHTFFTEKGRFRLVHDHHIQRGRSFPHPEDVVVDVPSGTVREVVHDGSGRHVKVRHLQMPANIANGMLTTAIKNMPAAAQEADVTYYSGGRLVRLAIMHDGVEKVWVGPRPLPATRYRIKVKIGGIAGLVAPLLGKQPQDVMAWYLEGDPPLMLRIDSQLYDQGPVWRFQLAGPAWQPEAGSGSKTR
jgi:hypothetical protein